MKNSSRWFRVPTLLLAVSAVCLTCASAQTRSISFSGYTWYVKASSGRVGPGPNYFSDSSANVWVDAQGQLHLKITNSGGKWYCSEVLLASSYGYGTYRFYLNTPVDNLDPNVVLGLFTWSNDPAYNHRELDIEFSRWGVVNNQNAQYVVQPYSVAGNLYRWEEPSGLTQTTHSFQWLSASVFFQSIVGYYQPPPAVNTVINQHAFTQGIPVPGGEVCHMNLWLYKGKAPTNRQPVEIIVNRFEFVSPQ